MIDQDGAGPSSEVQQQKQQGEQKKSGLNTIIEWAKSGRHFCF